MADTTQTTTNTGGLIATATQLPVYSAGQQLTMPQAVQAPTPEITPTVAPTVAAPSLVSNVTPPAPNAARTLTPKETVAGQLNELLKHDSAYMQNAKGNANAVMNARGLINSSLAAGATQKAAIESSLPIAQQDATATANAGQLAQQGNQDIKLTGFNAALGSAQAAENAQYRSDENAQNIQANKELRAQADTATYKLEMNKIAQSVGVDTARLSQADRARLTESFGTMTQQRIDAIARINAVPTSQLANTDKKAMIDQINYDYIQQSKALFTLNGFEYPADWDNVVDPSIGQQQSTDLTSKLVSALGLPADPTKASRAQLKQAKDNGLVTSTDGTQWVPNAPATAATQQPADAQSVPSHVLEFFKLPQSPAGATAEQIQRAKELNLAPSYNGKQWVRV